MAAKKNSGMGRSVPRPAGAGKGEHLLAERLSSALKEVKELESRLMREKFRLQAVERENETLRKIVSLIGGMRSINVGGAGHEKYLERLMDLVLDALNSDAGSLFLVDEASEELVFTIVKGPARDKLIGMRLRLGEGVAGWVAQMGQPYLAVNVSEDPRWMSTIARIIRYPTRDILCVPLKGPKGKVLGVIEVLNKQGSEGFTVRDLQFLNSFARHAAIVVSHMLLLTEASRRLMQLGTLADVSRLLNSTLSPAEVRKRAMEASTKLLGCEVSSLLLRDEETGELFFEVALGEKGKQLKEIRLKRGEGIAGWVAEHGEPVVIHDCSKDPRWSQRADRKSKFQTRNMICVPIIQKGETIGVLQALNKLDRSFTQEDVSLLTSLANQVAIAIDNALLYEEITNTFLDTADALSQAIDLRDPYTGGHTMRVTKYSLSMGRQLGLDEGKMQWLRLAAIMHDIGKIGVDDRILRKAGPLEEEEWWMMRRHPEFGAEIINHIDFLKDVVPGIKSHHERYDGKGYPQGIKGEDIPPIARIISVADAYDAMTTDRPYRKGLSEQEAVTELKRGLGSQFDPKMIEAFLKAQKRGFQ